MKQIITLSILFLSAFALSSCSEDEDSNKVSGSVTYNSNCKSFTKNTYEISNDESCVEFTFNESEMIVELVHTNAGFNCCPGDIFVEISQTGDSIIISEHSTESLCDCNCLYDVNILLENIKAETYQVVFIEPMVPNNESISFTMDLSEHSNGSYCVSRTDYPWGI